MKLRLRPHSVLKCLEKEPNQRYASAAALADDLERWLNGDIVQPRRKGSSSSWARVWRWARRYPTRAALAVLEVVTVGLVFVGVGVLLELNQAQQERDRAEEAHAEAVS